LCVGSEAILNHMNLVLGTDFQKGKTKIFIRHPEALFNLEELRDRTVYDYANTIQRFLQKTSMKKYYYELKKGVNDKFQGTKERKRWSVDRTFRQDYIKYRQNYKLKDCIGDRGKAKTPTTRPYSNSFHPPPSLGQEKPLFTDNCNVFDKSFFGSKTARRIIVVTNQNLYLVAIDANKDKIERKVKPFLYVLKRTVPLSKISGAVLSTFPYPPPHPHTHTTKFEN